MADILPLASDFPAVDEDRWKLLLEKALKGADFASTLVTETYDGLPIKPLYARSDEASAPGPRAIAAQRPWDIRQLCAEPDPALVNAALLDDLDGGATSVVLQIAAPGQIGVAVEREVDLARAIEGVRFEHAPLALLPGERYGPLMAMLHALIAERRLDGGALRCAINGDPLGGLARTGTLSRSLDEHDAQLADNALLARDHYPHMTTILADGRPYHDAGASEGQELAAMCATAVAYLRALDRAGIPPDLAFRQISVALAADTDQFATIAKLRAARLLLARLAEACGAGSDCAPVPLHATTSQRMLSERDPHTNLLRTTVACAAAAMGGADSITVLPFTWLLGPPDRFARRLARNVQIVLQEEAGLGRVADPAGGSWYTDSLTRALARKAWSIFQEIEGRGGMAAALTGGAIQAMIRATAELRARAVAEGREKLTGVSAYPHLEAAPMQLAPWPRPATTADPAVKIDPLPLRRPAEPFERLRDASDAHASRTGERPKVLLANLGRPDDFNDRAADAAGLFAAGGIRAVPTDGLKEPSDAVAAFKASGAALVCLCGSDPVYAEIGPPVVTALKEAGARHIYLVGDGCRQAALGAAGVETFLHQGCDMLKILGDALARLDVKLDH